MPENYVLQLLLVLGIAGALGSIFGYVMCAPLTNIIVHIKRNDSKHDCILPGAYKRWRHGLGVNSCIECKECGGVYVLKRKPSMDGPYNVWERVG